MLNPERFHPKDLVRRPNMLWTSLVRYINQGSNKWANRIFDDYLAPIIFSSFAASLGVFDKKPSARYYLPIVSLGITYKALEVIAKKTGGRDFNSKFTFKPD